MAFNSLGEIRKAEDECITECPYMLSILFVRFQRKYNWDAVIAYALSILFVRFEKMSVLQIGEVDSGAFNSLGEIPTPFRAYLVLDMPVSGLLALRHFVTP